MRLRSICVLLLAAATSTACLAEDWALEELDNIRPVSNRPLEILPVAHDATALDFRGCPETSCCNDREACSRCNCIWCREELTGDWGGRRTCLAEHGIEIESILTQYYQGVATGGAEQIFRYGAKFDLLFDFDTEEMGLWRGGKLRCHAAEWQFGQNSIADAASLAPVNLDQLAPTPESSYALTYLLLEQELGHGLAAMVGRYNLLDLWERFYPDYGLGLEGFMNVSLAVPFNAIVPALPSVSNVAGIVRPDERGLEAGLLVFETQNSPTTSGLDFPNGVTLLAFGRKFTEFVGLAGSHMLAANYGTGDFTSFESNGWIRFPPIVSTAPIPPENQGAWSAAYVGEQRLWEDPCDEKRHTKLWGYVGFSDETVNPFAVTAAATVEGFGYFDRRPDDRTGIGYFYSALSDDFRNLVSTVVPSGDVHGGEVYYNAAVTPWFHLTVDLQAIRPGFRANGTAVVLGVRGKLDF